MDGDEGTSLRKQQSALPTIIALWAGCVGSVFRVARKSESLDTSRSKEDRAGRDTWPVVGPSPARESLLAGQFTRNGGAGCRGLSWYMTASFLSGVFGG